MKIAIAQLNYTIGDFVGNQEKIMKAIRQAESQNADLICFAEMAVTGSPAAGLLEYDDFIDRSDEVLDHIKVGTDRIAVVIGAPERCESSGAKHIRSGLFYIHDREIQLIGKGKTFESAEGDGTCFHGMIEYMGMKIGLCTGGEEIVKDEKVIPADEKPDLIIQIAASLFDQEAAERRIDYLRAKGAAYDCPFFFVNHCGAQGGLVYDGGSLVVNRDGIIAAELSYFEEEIVVLTLKDIEAGKKDQLHTPDRMERIEKALLLGVRDYFQKTGFQKAILGLSGGLDSALVCVLAAKALGHENVRAVYLPGPFSSDHSAEDARALAGNLNVEINEIDIVKGYETINQTLHPVFGDRPFDVTEENIQARLRGLLLMALSNKLGYVLLNTSNKSEAAVGYTTLYGDMTGGLAVIADIYKSEVFELSRFINRVDEIIPQRILEKPPSAELRPDQKDSDSLPDYEILDSILYAFIEESKSLQEIVNLGYDENLVRRILKLVNHSEFKRNQAAPFIRISKKAFGIDRIVPVVNKYMMQPG